MVNELRRAGEERGLQIEIEEQVGFWRRLLMPTTIKLRVSGPRKAVDQLLIDVDVWLLTFPMVTPDTPTPPSGA
jgi:hypothetical protein